MLGFLAGIAGSLFAPWINWGIEKRRRKHDNRKELIRRARKFIASSEWDQLEFGSTVTYSEIRPHLSKSTIDSIEGRTITIREGRGGNIIKSQVLDDLSDKEKEWGII